MRIAGEISSKAPVALAAAARRVARDRPVRACRRSPHREHPVRAKVHVPSAPALHPFGSCGPRQSRPRRTWLRRGERGMRWLLALLHSQRHGSPLMDELPSFARVSFPRILRTCIDSFQSSAGDDGRVAGVCSSRNSNPRASISSKYRSASSPLVSVTKTPSSSTAPSAMSWSVTESGRPT